MTLTKNTEVTNLVLSQEVLQGQCVHLVSVTANLVVVLASPTYDDFPKTHVFSVVGETCDYLGAGENLVEEPFYLR